jgi:hypothetical protein
MTDRKHIVQFSFLLIIYSLGVFIFLSTPDFNVKRITAIAMAAFYPLWGIWHHHEHGHLNRSIVYEYLLIGLIILVGLLAIV